MFFRKYYTDKFGNKTLINHLKRRRKIWMLIPVFGTILFIALYIVASLYYPGGSQVDKNSIGFSWINNYWCNLLNEIAIDGRPNPAKPIAMTAMFILCLTLIYFWFLFPRYIDISKNGKLIIQISGTLSMAIAFFLFIDIDHDLITNLASFFGFVAMVGTIVGLYKVKWHKLFLFGLFNILLIGLNNYLYYNKGLIIYLPLVQKITFVTFLAWFCIIDINLFRREIITNKAVINSR